MVSVVISSNEKQIYNYLGLEVYFDSNSKQPIEFYGRSFNQISKAKLVFENGKYLGVDFSNLENYSVLENNDVQKFNQLIDRNLNDIIKYWIDHFIYNKEIPFESINKPYTF